jgi:hypothetical protein
MYGPPPPSRPPRRIRPVPIIALVAVLFLAAIVIGIGILNSGDDYQASAVDIPPMASPTEPEQATILVPPKEAAFVKAVRAAVSAEDLADDDDLSILNTGRGLCGQYPRLENGTVDEEDILSEVSEPSLDGLIEDPPDRAGQLAVKHLCPKYLPLLKRARGGFGEGPQRVGKDVRPGTYRTTSSATDCYWERSTRGGGTIANDFVTNAPSGVTVTIGAGDGGFTSRGCGDWVRVG